MSETQTERAMAVPLQGLPWRRWAPSLLHGVVWVALLVALWQGMAWLESSSNWPIRQVRIEGELHHTDRSDMAKALESYVSQGFFAINNRAVVAAAQALPWVRSARLQKIWPDTLVLTLEEHVAVARWNATDLLSEYGTRFTPESLDGLQDLPRLHGPDGHGSEVLQAYADLLRPMAQYGMQIRSLAKSDHGAWRAEFSSGLAVLIGQQAPVPRLEQAVAQLHKLGEARFGQIRQIDMRYPNGVAIAWKKGYTPDWMHPDGKSVALVSSQDEQG